MFYFNFKLKEYFVAFEQLFQTLKNTVRKHCDIIFSNSYKKDIYNIL